MYKIYGIKNCDTVKKALDLLDRHKVKYEFVDYKKTPPTKELLIRWKTQLGEWPVNSKGPTYRKIKDEFEKASDTKKLALLVENSSAIRRPLVEEAGKVVALGLPEIEERLLR